MKCELRDAIGHTLTDIVENTVRNVSWNNVRDAVWSSLAQSHTRDAVWDRVWLGVNGAVEDAVSGVIKSVQEELDGK